MKEYKDVFTWTCKDLRGIPLHLAQHWIEFNTNIPVSHQIQHQMNLNYVVVVKQDLDKLLVAGFIVLMEEATWLSSIVVVPKKNKKLQICVDFWKLNVTMKKYPYPLPFMEEVLDIVVGHEVYSFLGGFSSYHQIITTLEDKYCLHYNLGNVCLDSHAFSIEECSTNLLASSECGIMNTLGCS